MVKIDEKMSLRATIGLNAGMTLGMIAVFIGIILSGMVLWQKIFVAFGVFCAIILQVVGVISGVQRLKAYNRAMEEYQKLNTAQEPMSYHG